MKYTSRMGDGFRLEMTEAEIRKDIEMVYVASRMYEAGADGINFDTTGAAGDAEFYAALTVNCSPTLGQPLNPNSLMWDRPRTDEVSRFSVIDRETLQTP